jgi:hypothetical protein
MAGLDAVKKLIRQMIIKSAADRGEVDGDFDEHGD